MKSVNKYLVNGSFDQVISPIDRGFAYGDGVFRTMRMSNSLPDYWPQHYQKLVADCAAIGIVCPSAELLMSDLQQLFAIDEIAVAKIVITRGDGARGYAPPAITTPMRVVIKSAMPQYKSNQLVNGVNLHLCDLKIAHQPKLAGIKHLTRLENVMARMEWHDETIFDGLLLDQQGSVIECTMSNVFARVGNTLMTPDLSQCGVSGITRQRIIGLATVLKLNVVIANISLDELLQADEVVICNSLFGAFQVSKIGNTIMPKQGLAKTIRSALAL